MRLVQTRSLNGVWDVLVFFLIVKKLKNCSLVVNSIDLTRQFPDDRPTADNNRLNRNGEGPSTKVSGHFQNSLRNASSVDVLRLYLLGTVIPGLEFAMARDGDGWAEGQ